MAEEKKSLRCSFCGKSEGQVHRMIQGPGVRICDECVQLCMSILDDGYSAAMEEGLPFHFMRVRASSRSRTPLSSPMSAWKTLKVEQGGRRVSLRALLKTV